MGHLIRYLKQNPLRMPLEIKLIQFDNNLPGKLR